MIFLYAVLALVTSVAGALTGMGGGVIMKPVMDLLGHYDAATVGVLTAVSVLAMAMCASVKQLCEKRGQQKLPVAHFLLVGLGSVGGGLAGQALFSLAVQSLGSDNTVKLIQNIALLMLLAVIFLYMIFRCKIRTLSLKSPVIIVLTGFFLGVVAAFLGIGGGPVNVAVLMLLFSMDIKTAALGSVVTIMFSQLSKLGVILFTTGFGVFDLSVLPFIAAAACVGSVLGSVLKQRMSAGAVAVSFNIMQAVIMLICAANIVLLTSA